MSGGTLTAVVLVYGFALWLGLYLIVRDPRSPALLLTGLGLAAYALALACDLLADATPTSEGLEWVREPLLEVLSNVVDLPRSRGDLLLASFYQLSVYEPGPSPHQWDQPVAV